METSYQYIPIWQIEVPAGQQWEIEVPAGQQILWDLDERMASLIKMTSSEAIIVTRHKTRYRLFRGYRPLSAWHELGRSTIPAIVLEVEDLRKELAQINQRLRRSQLPALECAEHVIRRQQLLDALPPGTRYGNGPEPSHGKKARKKNSAAASAERPSSVPVPSDTGDSVSIDVTRCGWCGDTQSLLTSRETGHIFCECRSVYNPSTGQWAPGRPDKRQSH